MEGLGEDGPKRSMDEVVRPAERVGGAQRLRRVEGRENRLSGRPRSTKLNQKAIDLRTKSLSSAEPFVLG